ncbi:MAG: phosphatidylserine decarboxylase family protein [Bacteroidales bacterium]|nr:phosphatidylserine decarboxylase family protein [Bacteroidales bacterium]
MIRLHPEGKQIVYFSTCMLVGLTISLFILIPTPWIYPVTGFLLIIYMLIFRFFRIPDREYKEAPESILSPADGKVVSIENIYEGEYFNEGKIRVSIFMSIYNVHINRYPVTGKIVYCKYHPGNYLVARHPKSSERNERTTVVIRHNYGELLVRQIAGYVARRIVCYAEDNRNAIQNNELGFIKFGSRVDLFLPQGTPIKVKTGDTARGGITEIAALK